MEKCGCCCTTSKGILGKISGFLGIKPVSNNKEKGSKPKKAQKKKR